jgi:hypothetical protein
MGSASVLTVSLVDGFVARVSAYGAAVSACGVASSITVSVIGELIARVIDYARPRAIGS